MKRHSLKILKQSLFAITKKRVREGFSRLNGGKDTSTMKIARLLTAAVTAAVTLFLLAACGGGGSSTTSTDGTKTILSASVSAGDGMIPVGGTSATLVVKCTPTGTTTASQVQVAVSTATSPTTCSATGTSVTVTGPASVTVTPVDASGAAIGTAVTAQVTCAGTWDTTTNSCKAAVVALKYTRAQASYVYAAYNGYAPTQVQTASDGSKKMVATQNATVYTAGDFPIGNCKVLLAPLPKTGRIANRCTIAEDKVEREFVINPTTNKLTVYAGDDGALPVATSPLWLATSEANNTDPVIGSWMEDDTSITYVTRAESRVVLNKNKATGVVTQAAYPVGITTPTGFNIVRGMWSFSN